MQEERSDDLASRYNLDHTWAASDSTQHLCRRLRFREFCLGIRFLSHVCVSPSVQNLIRPSISARKLQSAPKGHPIAGLRGIAGIIHFRANQEPGYGMDLPQRE